MLLCIVAGSLFPIFAVGRRQMKADSVLVNFKPQAALSVMDKLVPAFETTLFDPTLSDMCVEMAELGIDSLLDEGLFKSVPVVGLLVGVAKTAQNLHDRNLLKQTVKFINTFNSKKLSQAQKEKYKLFCELGK